MTSTTLDDRFTHAGEISIRANGDLLVIGVEGKENAIALRRRLVRHGIACSFPAPTWEGARYEFHAKQRRNLSNTQLRDLVIELSEADRESELLIAT